MRRVLNLMYVAVLPLTLSACVTMQVEEGNFIRPDEKSGYRTTEKFDDNALQKVLPGAHLQEQALTTADHLELRGVGLQQDKVVATVLYFGGNMYHLDDSVSNVAKTLGKCGVNLVSFDYRGYGRSPGQPTVANMQDDALRIYDQVRAQTGGKLIVHGQSLGSFIAAYVAQQRPVDGLVLESTATNAYDWAVANTPWYAKPFVKIELSPSLQNIDNAAAVSTYHGHSLVLLGEFDKITPQELGRRVYQAIPDTHKQLVVSPGGGHNGLLFRPDVIGAYCSFVQSMK